MEFIITNAVTQPNQLEITSPLTDLAWPQFMLHDTVANSNWEKLYLHFPEYQFTFTDQVNNEIVAVANSIPFLYEKPLDEFPQEGWDYLLQKGVDDFESGITPNTMSALSIVITANYRGKRVSPKVLQEMKRIAKEKQLENLVAPVRPNLKCDYPLIPIEKYVSWRRDDGTHFDPWLRVHESVGAKIVKVCHDAMKIPGSIEQWEEWAKMKFPESGIFTVPGALVPVIIDIEKNEGLYIEPNVLVRHDLS